MCVLLVVVVEGAVKAKAALNKLETHFCEMLGFFSISAAFPRTYICNVWL